MPYETQALLAKHLSVRFVGWVEFLNPTMGNDNLIVGYCVPTQA
jgi:hypothetical protein